MRKFIDPALRKPSRKESWTEAWLVRDVGADYSERWLCLALPPIAEPTALLTRQRTPELAT